MNPEQAEYRTDIAHLARDMHKRDAAMLWRMFALAVAVGGLVVAAIEPIP